VRLRSYNLREEAEVTRIGRRAVEVARQSIVENSVIPSIAVQTLAQITADKNNYDVGPGEFFRISSDAARNITGILGGTDNRTIYISNVGAFTITLQDQNAGSTAANRIITGTGADVALATDDNAILKYDVLTNRWRLFV
jgi:hypothetical protein